jgi:hypothetical protein
MKMRKKVFWILLLVAFSVSAKLPEGSLLDGVKPDANGRIDILTVFSHQDDESIYGGVGRNPVFGVHQQSWRYHINYCEGRHRYGRDYLHIGSGSPIDFKVYG